jgi:hypothetical protein
MLDLDKINKNVLKDLREDLTDEQIVDMSPKQALDEFLSWHGIFNYTNLIWDTVQNLKDAEL